MKLEPCIILNTFLNFIDSQPEYCYELYSYKKVCIMSSSSRHSACAKLALMWSVLRVNTPFPSNVLHLSMCLSFVIYCKIILYHVYNDVELVLHEKRKKHKESCVLSLNST